MSWLSEFLGQDAQGEAVAQGRADQQHGARQAIDTLRGYNEQAEDTLRHHYGVAGRTISDSRNSANRSIAQMAGMGRDAMGDAYKDQRVAYDPYRRSGQSALNQLSGGNLVGDISKNPAFQFRMEQGQNAIDSNMSAKGMLNSGARLKALQKFGQGLASEEYGREYDRQANRLGQLAGLGFNAASGMAGAAGQYGAGMANSFQGQGTQMGANSMNAGLNRANLFRGMGDTLAQGREQLGSNIANVHTGLANTNAASRMAGVTSPMQGLQSLAGLTKDVAGAAGGVAALFSDSRLKTNVVPLKKSELKEMRKHLKAVRFNYINDEHGEGDWAGVMAQDLEKSKIGRMLVSEKDGKKVVDMKKVLSMFLSTQALGA